jgi:hypothetical protein
VHGAAAAGEVEAGMRSFLTKCYSPAFDKPSAARNPAEAPHHSKLLCCYSVLSTLVLLKGSWLLLCCYNDISLLLLQVH